MQQTLVYLLFVNNNYITYMFVLLNKTEPLKKKFGRGELFRGREPEDYCLIGGRAV